MSSVARLPEYARRVALTRARLAFDWSSLLDFDPAQPRDERGRWTTGVPNLTEGVEDLVEIVNEIERLDIEPERLYGGQSAETVVFRLPDGRKIVRKRAPKWGDEYAPVQAADAEQLAGVLATVLDVPVARSYRGDRETVYVEWLDGEPVGSDAVANFKDFGSSPSLVRMGLLDVLSGNTDRHQGNLYQTANGIVGIDQGHAWIGPRGVESTGDPVWAERTLDGLGHADETSPNGLFAEFRGGDVHWKDNPMTADDVAETRRRLESKREVFRAAGREDWLDYSLRALDDITPYAKGTVSIYGD